MLGANQNCKSAAITHMDREGEKWQHLSLVPCPSRTLPLSQEFPNYGSWNLPLWTKTSVFTSYPIISYKRKNKSFIKLLFCFLRVSRSHNPVLVAGSAAAWTAPGHGLVLRAQGCPRAKTKSRHPLLPPQPQDLQPLPVGTGLKVFCSHHPLVP